MERIGWLLAALGIVLYCTAVPSGRQVLSVGFLTLAVVYFIQVFAPTTGASNTFCYPDHTPEPTQNQSFITQVLLPYVQCLASTVTLVGIMFKMQFLPGSAPLLAVGTTILLVATLVQLAIGNLFRRAAIIMVLGFTTWATPNETLIRLVYRRNPVLVEKLLYSIAHPEDRAAAAEARRLQYAASKH